MMILQRFAIAVTLATSTLPPCLVAAEEPYFGQRQYSSDVYVFGDSLSDIGNVHQLNPRSPMRFTNPGGRVAVEVMAATLNLTQLSPSFHLSTDAGAAHGNNYAVAGARAVDNDGDEATPDINLPTQVNAFLRDVAAGGVRVSALLKALYVIGIGGNDVIGAQRLRASAVLAPTQQERQASIEEANSSIRAAAKSQIAQIKKLISAGARNIVILGCPDVGGSPLVDIEAQLISNAVNAAQMQNDQMVNEVARLPREASLLSKKYNRILRRTLRRLEKRNNNVGVKIVFFDLYAFTASLVNNAPDNGFTNTDDACTYVFSQGGAVNPECAADFPLATGFLFWDELHPTAVTHNLVGQALADAVLSGSE